MNEVHSEFWKKCSSCKKPIAHNVKYYVCSVSTCNNQRTGYAFCSVGCWEAHVPAARHRDAAAIEQVAPAKSAVSATVAAPSRRIIGEPNPAPSRPPSKIPREVLIIASRLKEFIDASSGGYNTSQSVVDVLSDHVRAICEKAIENARADGRKTVMDRDFRFIHIK
jgi:hypothetical protein